MKPENIVLVVLICLFIFVLSYAFGVFEGQDWAKEANKKMYMNQDLAWATYMSDKESNAKENEALLVKVRVDAKRLNLKLK
jgi:hypothetical protein